jgi:hypothetical protein
MALFLVCVLSWTPGLRGRSKDWCGLYDFGLNNHKTRIRPSGYPGRQHPAHRRLLPNEVGGWPDYKSGDSPVCSANDGIPDEWKKAHGISLTDANVANAVNDEGYTELEVYLNSLTEH